MARGGRQAVGIQCTVHGQAVHMHMHMHSACGVQVVSLYLRHAQSDDKLGQPLMQCDELGVAVRRRHLGKCMACAWHVHGMRVACAWHVHLHGMHLFTQPHRMHREAGEAAAA